MSSHTDHIFINLYVDQNFQNVIPVQWLNAMSVIRILVHEKGREEGNVLFNDALTTFYLRLYDIKLMVNDHSDSERGNTLPPLYG